MVGGVIGTIVAVQVGDNENKICDKHICGCTPVDDWGGFGFIERGYRDSETKKGVTKLWHRV